MPMEAFLANLWTWWQGDASAMIIVTPLILSWHSAGWPRFSPARALEAIALAIALGATAVLVFGGLHPDSASISLAFLTLPYIIWAAIRYGPRGVTTATALLCTIAIGIFTMRSRLALLPGRRQTVGEALYDVAQTQIAQQGLPTKALGRWFPYVATLLLFIFTVNLLGFIPLPLTGETWHGVPTWGIYAATSSLSVTLALALLTFVFTHYEGIKWNGPSRYFKSWIPEAPKGLLLLIVPLEVLGQFMRLISLSVRLFANMLAGHILILTFLGLIFIFESLTLVFVIIPATVFYIFEVVIVVGIQAFIFAALSAIYIGSAIEPEH